MPDALRHLYRAKNYASVISLVLFLYNNTSRTFDDDYGIIIWGNIYIAMIIYFYALTIYNYAFEQCSEIQHTKVK